MQPHKIYTIYDRKAQYCLPVFSFKSDADAIRSFTQIVVSSDTDIAKYPADFDLIAIATLNIETGQCFEIMPMQILINGLVALQTSNNERDRYKKVLDKQLDIEDFMEKSDAT